MKNMLESFFGKVQKPKTRGALNFENFNAIRLTIASPEQIREWSYGEVKKPETVNYRTLKPERDGLFCERIFGPVKTDACSCGKYTGRKYHGQVCDRCGVEVTDSRVRRERFGHIELAAPVAHIWFLRKPPSRIGQILNMKMNDLEKVVYYTHYLVTADLKDDSGRLILSEKTVLRPDEYRDYFNRFGNKLQVDIGALAVRKLLERIDLKKEVNGIYRDLIGIKPQELDEFILEFNRLTDRSEKKKLLKQLLEKTHRHIDEDRFLKELEKIKDQDKQRELIQKRVGRVVSEQDRSRLIKRLRILEGFLHSQTRPEWTILTVLPVIPPDLRPLVSIDGGRFATSDLNDLYRRLINRNNRLRHIIQLRAPLVMINNEKRLLQEAVDALLDNESRPRPVLTGINQRPLKSLSESLRGKQGRFRQNLLGKRVDYSSRSVIVVGPHLKIHQCGLPKEIALELFKPFIIRELTKTEKTTLKAARKLLDRKAPEVWNILEKIISDHPVLLNRAPTLHRLSIQAFEPVLIEGRAIQLPPLTCAAFNADFDGDQMAVHLPLSPAAQLEAKILMLSSNNILSPASGKPLAVPSQDMVLGCCYLTKVKKGVKGEGTIFASMEEVLAAYQRKAVDLHARIKVKGINQLKEGDGKNTVDSWKDYTTVGRVIFNSHLEKDLRFIKGISDGEMDKKQLTRLVDYCYKNLGHYNTVVLLDELKKIGFQYATLAGISISVDEMIVPSSKKEIVEKASKEVKEVEKLAKQGLITEGERYNKVIDIWTHATDRVSEVLFDEMRKKEKEPYVPGTSRFNSIFLMADSGARGSRQQVRQLAGMRGLMAKPQKRLTGGVGEIIESPVISNFREGLSVLEYFISTHGGRKGLADTALKTSDAGYLTRRLIDVAHDVVVTMEDCKTINGIRIGALQAGEEIVETIAERITGRISLDNIANPITDEVLVRRGEVITEEVAKKIADLGIDKIGVRSPLTCEAERGICSKCYGINPATGRMVEVGEAVGIIAAQSIGEPGTQLTLRTFHIGGTASRILARSEIYAEYDGEISYLNFRGVKNRENRDIVTSRNAELVLTEYPVTPTSHRKTSYQIPYGARLYYPANARVKKGTLLADWDPHTKPIIAEVSGRIRLEDVKEGVTLKKEKSPATGTVEKTIIAHPTEKLRPRILIEDTKTKEILQECPLLVDTILVVDDKENVVAGDILAKIPQEVAKTRDITGGLPRVAELFEARRPKIPAVISEINGVVELDQARGRIIVRDEKTKRFREYAIPHGRHALVYNGDRVRVGDPLTDGSVDPHDILRVKSPKEVQEYLVNEIQQVYRLQGVTINDKHIEIIVRQMLSNVRIEDAGDSTFLDGEIVSRYRYQQEWKKLKKEKKRLPVAKPVLLGITKASLSSDSFISAASFQDTTRVLTDAAVGGEVDYLRGLKENVIIGRLIPAGTGLRNNV